MSALRVLADVAAYDTPPQPPPEGGGAELVAAPRASGGERLLPSLQGGGWGGVAFVFAFLFCWLVVDRLVAV